MTISPRFVRSALCAGLLGLVAGLALAAGGGVNAGGGSTAPTTASSTSGSPTVAGEILVKLRSTNALQPLLAKYPLSLVSRFGARPIYRLKVVGTVRPKDILPSLSLETDVLIAEENASNSTPESKRQNVPWAIGTASAYATQWGPQRMRVPEAQALALGQGVRVAVLDTGIDATHPALAGRLLPGRDFVDDDLDPSEVGGPGYPSWGHGTHVAGLIAMVAPGARIMPVRVLDANGAGNAWVLAEAILWALDPDGNPDTDDGAHVINLSLGSFTRTRILDTIAQIATCAPAVPDDPIGDRSDPGYADDTRRCSSSNGAVVIAAAGNDASGSLKEYPAAEGAYGLFSVAASNGLNQQANFTNYGTWIDLAAPGEGLTSTVPGGGYGTWSGTSMASPLVAGTAALVRSVAPSLAPKDVLQRLKRATTQLCGSHLFQLDAYSAVRDDRRPKPLSCK